MLTGAGFGAAAYYAQRSAERKQRAAMRTAMEKTAQVPSCPPLRRAALACAGDAAGQRQATGKARSHCLRPRPPRPPCRQSEWQGTEILSRTRTALQSQSGLRELWKQ